MVSDSGRDISDVFLKQGEHYDVQNSDGLAISVSFVWLHGCTSVVFADSKHETELRMPNADAGVQGAVQVG